MAASAQAEKLATLDLDLPEYLGVQEALDAGVGVHVAPVGVANAVEGCLEELIGRGCRL